MITILLLYFYFSQGKVTAAPLVTTSIDILARNTFIISTVGKQPACTCPDQRSIWDIVWSCLATIFLCTWVSVHPDIPDLEKSLWKITLRRLELVVWTLLTPEYIIFWAWKQWVGAREISREQKGALNVHVQQKLVEGTYLLDTVDLGRGWGRTHGYFMQMGGFMLHDGSQKMGTLSYERFKELLAKDRIKFPTINQEEIEDRSKSDGLSKLLVVSQTGWFILQCITRKMEKLPITELELTTLAFAALNGCMYFFWWNKPFDVRAPVLVKLRRKKLMGNPSSGTNVAEVKSTGSAPIPHNLHSNARVQFVRLLTWPWSMLLYLLRRMIDMMGVDCSADVDLFDDPLRSESEVGPNQVPFFYAMMNPNQKIKVPSVIVLCVVSSIFGLIHCAGSFFYFPTVVELRIWRISSVYIAAFPILTVAGALLIPRLIRDEQDLMTCLVIAIVVGIPGLIGGILYIIARLLLLAESLITLRDLPPEAYSVVRWTSFIPHI